MRYVLTILLVSTLHGSLNAQNYTLGVSYSGFGSITSSPGGINTSAGQFYSLYASGTLVQLTATPTNLRAVGGPYSAVFGSSLLLSASGSTPNTTFTGWIGATSSSGNIANVFMNTNKSVAGTFTTISSISSYAFDLDNNGTYEYSSSSPTFTVPAASLGSFGLGTFPMQILVTDGLGNTNSRSTNFSITPVPEPSTILLFSVVAAGLMIRTAKSRRDR